MTTFEIRTELADRYCVKPDKVRCSNCEYWGYNRGKVMNSMGESKCMKRKNGALGVVNSVGASFRNRESKSFGLDEQKSSPNFV